MSLLLWLLWYASTFDSFGVLICYNLVTGNTLPKIFFPCFLEIKIRASWGYFLNSKSATLMGQAHAFFFSKKKDSKKKFNSWRIHPFFIFLKLFDSNYCDEGTQGRLLFSNDIFAVVTILYLEFFNTKEFKALSAKK